MSSALVSYSSGEEDEMRTKSGKRRDDPIKQQADVNYDDVQMEMSDDDGDTNSSDSSHDARKKDRIDSDSSRDDKPPINSDSSRGGKSRIDSESSRDEGGKVRSNSDSLDPDRELFQTEAEYKAYKNQFVKEGSNGNKQSRKTPDSEYGSVQASGTKASNEESKSEYGSDVRPPIDKAANERLKRLRQMSNEDYSKESDDERNVANVDPKRKRSHPEKERSGTRERSGTKERSPERPPNRDAEGHRRRHDRSRSKSPSRNDKRKKEESRNRPRHHHRRHRSRSRSRSRDRHTRRHRSRSSSRERRHHHRDQKDHPRLDRQELRNRKLCAMGFAQPLSGGMNDIHLGSNPTPTPAALAAAALANSLSGEDQVQAQLAHVKAVTGVDLPKYYNPTAINPLKYAEQIKKRQLLWGFKKAESTDQPPPVQKAPEIVKPAPVVQPQSGQPCSFNKWEKTNFGNSQANEKFRRLMGIKNATTEMPEESDSAPVDSKKTFEHLEQEYERARAITHTQRGLGLGFTSAGVAIPGPGLPPPPPKPPQTNINFVKK